MDDCRKSAKIPRPMTDPCQYCPTDCKSKEQYKCDLFKVAFIQSWDNTISFLKEQLGLKKEA